MRRNVFILVTIEGTFSLVRNGSKNKSKIIKFRMRDESKKKVVKWAKGVKRYTLPVIK